MAQMEDPPFQRGNTVFSGSPPDSTSQANIEGQEWWFQDLDFSVPNTTTPRTSQRVRCRAVRNVSGITLEPKRLVNLALTAGKFGNRVDGYARLLGQRTYPIDEWLVGGVVANDICWIVVDGPAVIKTDLATLGANVVVGDWLVGQTAVTSQATTAGRVIAQDLTGATAVLGANIQGRIGEAMSALTTANTNADLLVMVGKW